MDASRSSRCASRRSRVSDIVTITRIAVGGEGVGRLSDGCVVFVPRTAPGDRIRLREGSLHRHRNFARAELGEIVESGPGRVAPPCPHYVHDHCGGCQLQHLAYDEQLKAKTAVGLHPYDRPNFVFPLADCHITDFRLMALWRELRSRLALLPQPLTRLTLRLDREERRHIIAESAGEPWLNAEDLRGRLVGTVDGEVVCWWHPVDGAARVVAGPATGFPATAFEQVNPGMGMITRRWAVEQLGDVRSQTVWDLYGGIGDTAALLVERGATVVSVDADEKAVSWGRARLPAARFIAAKAEDVMPSLPPPHAVVLNPPRAGLHWDVSLRLTSEPVPKIVYISCDPATLARDLQRLNVNYVVKDVRAFDLFPQTAHVETVAVLEAA